MSKSKNNKSKINVKPLHNIIRRLSEAVLLYTAADYLMRASNEVEVGVVAFGMFWIATDLAIWSYRYIVQPAAKAIASSN